MKIFWAILTVLSVAFSFDCSGSNSLKVTESWARAAAQGENTDLFALITNNTKEPDTLVSVSSDLADTVEIYKTSNVDGVMQPSATDKLAIGAGKSLRLLPDKHYIHLTNLHEPLVAGATIHVRMGFEKSGVIDQNILIQPADTTKFTD